MADKYWIGAAGGTWGTAGNWSPSGVPATGDNLFFTQGGEYTLDLPSTSYANWTITDGYYTFNAPLNTTSTGNIDWAAGCCGGITSGTLIFAGTGTKTVSTNDAPINRIIYSTGHTRTLTSNLTVISDLVIQTASAIFNGGTNTITAGSLNFAGTTASRQFNTSGNIYLTGENITVFAMGTSGITYTFDTYVNIYVTNAGDNTTTTGISSSIATMPLASWYFTQGSYSLNFLTGANNRAINVVFEEFYGNWNATSATATISGNLILSPVMTCSVTPNVLTFTSGTLSYAKDISGNGVALNRPITFSGADNYWAFQSDLNVNAAVIIGSAHVDANAHNLSCTTFTMNNAGSIYNFNGYYTGTDLQPILEITGSGTSFNKTNGLISVGASFPGGLMPVPKISMTSASAKTFSSANTSFFCTLSNDGVGALTILGAHEFWDITNFSGISTSIIFPAGFTQNTYNFTADGLTMTSNTPGTQFIINNPTSYAIKGANNLSIRDAAFTPAPRTDGYGPYLWYGGEAVANNQGNVTGIAFIPNDKVMYVITDPGTFNWPLPSDWNFFNNEMHLWGAGGGGGGATSGTTSRYPGAGGGGGGYTQIINCGLKNIDNTITITVGAGGAGGGVAGTFADREGVNGTNTVITTTDGAIYIAEGGNGGLGGGFGGGGFGGGFGGSGLTANGGNGGGASEYTGTGNYYQGGGGGGGAGGNAGDGGGGENGSSLSTTYNVFLASAAGGGGSGGSTPNGETPGGNNNRGFGGGTANNTTRPILAARAGGGGAAYCIGSIGTDVWDTVGGAGGSGTYAPGVSFGGGGGGGFAATSSQRSAGAAGGGGAVVIVYSPYTPSDNNFLQMFDIFENKYI